MVAVLHGRSVLVAFKNEYEIRLTNFNDDECNTVMALLDDLFAR